MKFEIYKAHQLYTPESDDDARLVFVHLHNILQMQCDELSLWGENERFGAWFPASCQMPVDRHGQPMNAFISTESDRPDAPWYMTVEVALPTTFESGGRLPCRWSRKLAETKERDAWITIASALLPEKYTFDEDTLVATIARIFSLRLWTTPRNATEIQRRRLLTKRQAQDTSRQ